MSLKRVRNIFSMVRLQLVSRVRPNFPVLVEPTANNQEKSIMKRKN